MPPPDNVKGPTADTRLLLSKGFHSGDKDREPVTPQKVSFTQRVKRLRGRAKNPGRPHSKTENVLQLQGGQNTSR